VFDILGQTVRDIGIGAGGMTALAIAGLLVKRGISGTFSIGNAATQDKADAAEKRHIQREEESDKYNREACNLRHTQIDREIASSQGAIDKLEQKVEAGFGHVNQKLDRVIDHLLK
jgi:hypothetical protein